MEQAPREPRPTLESRLERLGLDFLAEFLETVTRRQPANVEALAELGHVYTRQGRVDRGLEVDRRLVRLVPQNPTVHYNLACSLALAGQADEALDALSRAIDLGYDDPVFMARDEDLTSLHRLGRFQDLLRRLGADPAAPRRA